MVTPSGGRKDYRDWGQRDGYRVSFLDDENVLEPEKRLHNIANYDMSLLEMAFKAVHFDLLSNFKRGRRTLHPNSRRVRIRCRIGFIGITCGQVRVHWLFTR